MNTDGAIRGQTSGGPMYNALTLAGAGGGGAAAMNYFKTRPADGNSIMTFTVGHAITMAKGKTSLTVDEMAPIARGTNDPKS